MIIAGTVFATELDAFDKQVRFSCAVSGIYSLSKFLLHCVHFLLSILQLPCYGIAWIERPHRCLCTTFRLFYFPVLFTSHIFLCSSFMLSSPLDFIFLFFFLLPTAVTFLRILSHYSISLRSSTLRLLASSTNTSSSTVLNFILRSRVTALHTVRLYQICTCCH